MTIEDSDKVRTQEEVCQLFQEKYFNLPPISQSTANKIEMTQEAVDHQQVMTKK